MNNADTGVGPSQRQGAMMKEDCADLAQQLKEKTSYYSTVEKSKRKAQSCIVILRTRISTLLSQRVKKIIE